MRDKLKRYAIVISLVEKLNKQGSWCGETHIQKAMYFLNELFPEVINYPFMLYKYGPFSFELRDDIGIMVTEDFLRAVPMYPYGPKIIPGKLSEKIKLLFSKTLNKCEEKIEFVAENLKNKTVLDLEAIATALYVIKTNPTLRLEEMTAKLHHLKPHISFEQAEKEIEEVKKIIEEARNLNHKS